MKPKRYEVIIVGGGPAGSSCAYELAKSGVDVALFDHSHPREKPCGGAVSRQISSILKIPQSVIEKKIEWLILEGPDGNQIKVHDKYFGVLVMREKFDYWLLKRAKRTGIKHIKENVIRVENKGEKWLVKTNKNEYESDFLVGADGVNSLVRRKLIGPIPMKQLGHCVGYHIKHKSEYIESNFKNALEIYFLGHPFISIGYAWIFPKYEHVTVGLGTKLGVPGLKKSLDLFLKNHSATKRIIVPNKAKIHSYLVPAISDTKFFNIPLTGKNWVLIGDAAGHVNPITGEGIYYAVSGGRLAAKAYLKKDISLYEVYWKENFGSDLIWGARIQKVFYNTRLLSILLRIAKRSPELQKIFANIIVPDMTYKKMLFFHIPWKMPKILLELFNSF